MNRYHKRVLDLPFSNGEKSAIIKLRSLISIEETFGEISRSLDIMQISSKWIQLRAFLENGPVDTNVKGGDYYGPDGFMQMRGISSNWTA